MYAFACGNAQCIIVKEADTVPSVNLFTLQTGLEGREVLCV
jgi:hypothetical protein